MQQSKRITVFGGSGFIGRCVVQALLREMPQAVITIPTRDPEQAKHCKPAGNVGQVTLLPASIHREEDVARAVAGANIVINLCGILYEKGRSRFTRVHTDAAERIAKAAKAAGVEKLIHISALGVDKSPYSAYARSKFAGEKAVTEAFPKATILRPGVVFGPGDNFFNQFARMARLSPVMPLIGGGHTRFQPVYVGDVANAVLAACRSSESAGKTYELAGPDVVSFREILEFICRETGHHRPFITLPFTIASMMGFFGQFLPRPPLTEDQVRLLKQDNILAKNAKNNLEALGITPRSLYIVVPEYLAQYRAGGPLAALPA